MKKKYRVFFAQINATYVDVEATSPRAAVNKAAREVKDDYYPQLDAVEYDNHKLKERVTLGPEDIY